MATKKTSDAQKPTSSKKNSTNGSSKCCQGTPPGTPQGTSHSATPAGMRMTSSSSAALFTSSAIDSKKKDRTRITVKYDVGFTNTLYLRGMGASLNWEKGIPMKNVKKDEWIWETDSPFTTLEFKVLINDRDYETGENHKLSHGHSIQYTPKF